MNDIFVQLSTILTSHGSCVSRLHYRHRNHDL